MHTSRFIRRGRDLGFSMAEIADLLKLWQNRRRASADVKRIALAHVADLDRRMMEMVAMKKTLENLADCCRGDEWRSQRSQSHGQEAPAVRRTIQWRMSRAPSGSICEFLVTTASALEAAESQ